MTSDVFYPLQWPIAEQHVLPRTSRPTLSVVIPTFNRPDELGLAIESIASQLQGDLADKVEIVISDNASEPEVQDRIRGFAVQYPGLCYYLNAANGGGELQFLTAPHRARGEWTWLFGDDDLLAAGGMAHIVGFLERERPFFVTLNRCVVDNDLKTLLSATKHNIPSQIFPNIVELIGVIGIDQITFITSQIYHTDTARKINQDEYRYRGSHFAQVGYLIEAYANLPSKYDASVFVVHRWQPNDGAKHAVQFQQLSSVLPRDIAFARDRAGLAMDLMERLGGVKNADPSRPSKLTFVDYLLHYLFASVAGCAPISEDDWEFLKSESRHWRADRLAHLSEAQAIATRLAEMDRELGRVQSERDAIQQRQGMADALKRLAATPLNDEAARLEAERLDLRRHALELSKRFA